MPYEMRRVFFGAAPSVAERAAFHDVIGEVNGSAMERGVLFVPVSIPQNIVDKRVFQGIIDDNIKASTYYVQLSDDTPAPPQMDFTADYQLAKQYLADPAQSMRGVASLPPGPEFAVALRAQLVEWLG